MVLFVFHKNFEKHHEITNYVNIPDCIVTPQVSIQSARNLDNLDIPTCLTALHFRSLTYCAHTVARSAAKF